jgi:hypothetical protein
MAPKAVCGAGLILLAMSISPAQASDDGLSRPRAAVAAPTDEGTGRALNVLYGSYAALQVLDVTSTVAALHSGAAEVNPIVRAIGGETAQFLLLKAGTGAAVIALNRSLAKKSKKAAIVTMVALNVATAAVVAHNMRNARR